MLGSLCREIDGVGSFSVFNDSVPCSAVATALALPTLRYTLDLNAAGQSPCHAIQMAASAIRSGYANAIVIFRALNGRSGVRIGHGAIPGGAGAYRYPIGYSSYLMYIAMWARRYMIETGATAAELGAVAVAQRWYAQREQPCRRSRAARYRDLLSFAAGLRPVPRCRLHFGS